MAEWEIYDASGNLILPWAVVDPATGLIQPAQFPALTGDLTTPGGSLVTTLANVNGNVGSFTYASITVNAKGLVTAASSGAAPTTDAPTNASYWTRVAESGLSNESRVDALAVGALIKVGASGAPAAAVAGTDYQAAGVEDNLRVLLAYAQIGGTPVNPIDIQNIPTGYKALELIINLRSNVNGNSSNMLINFNNDATIANYRSAWASLLDGVTWNGGTFFAVTKTGGYAGNSFVGNNGFASANGHMRIFIPNYADTTLNKLYNYTGFTPTTTTHFYNTMGGGIWGSTAAINRIQITADLGSWMQGSTYYLYGLKA